eukprot:465928_1
MAMQVEVITPGAINENEIGEDPWRQVAQKFHHNECRNPTDDQSERQQHYASSVSDVIQNEIKACGQCTFHNPSTAIQCQICGNPLTVKHNAISTETLTPGSQTETIVSERINGATTRIIVNQEHENATAGSLGPQLERILKENGLYDDLHKILSDYKCELEDLKVMTNNDVDKFWELTGLSLARKLKFRRLIKALSDTVDQPAPCNEAKQSEEDRHYAQIQAKKKTAKKKAKKKMESDDKMTVILIGDTFAGKTSLFRNFIGDAFASIRGSTVGIDSGWTIERLAGKNMEVHVIDSGGQARWQAACKPYYKRVDCVFVCFSVVNENHDAFDGNLWHWRQAIEDYAPDDAIVMFVGCKTDLISRNIKLYQKNRKLVEYTMKQPLWKKFNPSCFECSSKTGWNVKIVFRSAVQAVMEHRNPSLKRNPKTHHKRSSQKQSQKSQNIQLHRHPKRTHHVNRNPSCC